MSHEGSPSDLASLTVRDFNDVPLPIPRRHWIVSFSLRSPPTKLERSAWVDIFRSSLPNTPRETWSFRGWPTLSTSQISSREEAHAWFFAATLVERSGDSLQSNDSYVHLLSPVFGGCPSVEWTRDRIKSFHRSVKADGVHYTYLFDLLALLHPFETALSILIDATPKRSLLYYIDRVPALTESVHPAGWNTISTYARSLVLDSVDSLDLVTQLMMIAPDQQVTRQLLDLVDAGEHHKTHKLRLLITELLVSLDDAAEVGERAQKLATRGDIRLSSDLLEYLARHDRYADIARLLTVRPVRSIPAECLTSLEKVHARVLVDPMLALTSDATLGKQADDWLSHEGANAIERLIEIATRRGKQRQHAVDLLQSYLQRGYEPLVRELVEKLSDAPRKAVAEMLGLSLTRAASDTTEATQTTPPVAASEAPSTTLLITASSGILPSFSIDSLGALRWRDGSTSPHGTAEGLISQLAIWAAGNDPPVGIPMPTALHDLVARLAPRSLDHWTQQLLDLFKKAHSRLSDAWVLRAVFLAPSDGTILALSRASTTNGYAAIDVVIRQYLTALDRPTALYLLAAKPTYEQTEALRDLARRRHESLDELLDGAAPTCGMALDGSRKFTVAQRVFTLRIVDRGLVLFDDRSHPLRALPQSRSLSDLEGEEMARRDLATCKDLVKGVLALHTPRLETSMNEGRIWATWQWRTLFVDHPVLVALTRSIVWETCGAGVTPLKFRIAEDRSYADVDDTSVDVDREVWVRIARPDGFSASERASWAALFDGYQIIQPFAQVQLASE